MSIALQGNDAGCGGFDQLTVNTSFENENLVLRTEDFLLIFFEFLGDVAFGIDKRLFANPLFGNKLFVGVAHLHVVAEDIVESYLQTLDAGACDFALLDLKEIVFARSLDVAQFIELYVHSFVDDSAFVEQERRVESEFALDALTQFRARREFFSDGANALLGRSGTDVFEDNHRLQGST